MNKMFKVEVTDFSNPTLKLLANIQDLLTERNDLLRQVLTAGGQKVEVIERKSVEVENKANIETMGRNEILALIKTLPQGTIKGKYMTMGIDELRKAVKEVIKCKQSAL